VRSFGHPKQGPATDGDLLAVNRGLNVMTGE
jgi:hypothetical protein